MKAIRLYYCSCHSCDTNRYPLFMVSISLPQKEIDVNLDPNKTQVLIHNDVGFLLVRLKNTHYSIVLDIKISPGIKCLVLVKIFKLLICF